MLGRQLKRGLGKGEKEGGGGRRGGGERGGGERGGERGGGERGGENGELQVWQCVLYKYM